MAVSWRAWIELGEVGAVPRARPEVARAVRARSTAPGLAGSVPTRTMGAPCSRALASSSALTGDGEAAAFSYSQRVLMLTAPSGDATCGAPRASALSASRMTRLSCLPSPLILPTATVVTPGTAASWSTALFRVPSSLIAGVASSDVGLRCPPPWVTSRVPAATVMATANTVMA